MKAPKSLFDRPGRAAAAVGAVVAVSATAAVAMVSGTAIGAPAQEAGRCTQNVNVRSEPDVESQIVALCESGTEVQVGESRAGFLQLSNLGGWAAQEYISVNGQPPADPERATEDSDSDSDSESDSESDSDSEERATREGEDSTADEDGTGSSTGSDETTGDESSDGSDESSDEESASDESDAPAPRSGGGGGLGGLLG